MITRNSRLTACVLAGAVVFSTIPTQAVYATTNAEVKNYITGGTYSFSVGASSAINETIVLDDMNNTGIAENETQVVAEPVSEYMNIAITQVNEYLNVRAEANEEAEVLGKLYNSGAATVLETVGEWYKITSGTVTGYVHSDYVVVGDEELCKSVSTRTATVATEALKFRKEANTECGVYALLEEGKNLQIVEDEEVAEGWYKVTDGEDVGYVSSEYVTVERNYAHAESKEEEAARLAEEQRIREEEERRRQQEAQQAAQQAAQNQSQSQSQSQQATTTKPNTSYNPPTGGTGQSVADYAVQFVGNPYVWGGTSLTNGADCSGFVQSVYKSFGVSLPRTSTAQRSAGYGVSVSEIQPGDIVCYNGHVAIYIGNGKIVHASNRKDGIKISRYNYQTIVAVRRIF